MEDIINSILEIDRTAKDRIKQAEATKDKIISEAKEEEKRIMAGVEERVAARVERIELDEQKDADLQIAEIEKKRDADIAELDKIFSSRCDGWKKRIVSSIIG